MGANNKESLSNVSASESDEELMSEEECANNEELDGEESEAEDVEGDEAMAEEDDADEQQPGPSKVRTISEASADDKPEKKRKRGIIYISAIPKHMTVTILREMLGQYAKISRVYLQPAKSPGIL